MGGATLYIETVADRIADSKGCVLKSTGKMGDVMKESTEIALTFAKQFLGQVAPDNSFFSGVALHIHIPEGATPKDGPSAGVTLVTSLLSLALQRVVSSEVAMTGEVTLTGKVLAIGGVKEKVIAAKRSGVTRVLLPDDNRRDWDELEAQIKEGVVPTFCKEYRDVFKAVFETGAKKTKAKKTEPLSEPEPEPEEEEQTIAQKKD
jgi:Lon-like ATP-dependent protease